MDDADSDGCGLSAQAALIIEGEAYAAAYLERMRSGASPPGDLANLVEFLDGTMLDAFCRALEMALEVAP